ncbi:MAG: hypothetical protein KF740_16360 [Ramlibacter sp.]|nr:hypothetical protein [Ramlibacter sp.]
MKAAWVIALLQASAAVASAQEVGRLLLSPAERMALERALALANQPANSRSAEAAMPAGPQTGGAEPQVVNGWVLRSGGHSTVWVNGQPYYRFEEPGAARQALAARGLVAPQGTSPLPGQLKLRPGQTQVPELPQPLDLLPPGAFRRSGPAKESGIQQRR